MRKSMVANVVFGLVIAIFVGPASASSITWGTPQNISGDSDIVTAGTSFVDAVQTNDETTTRTIGDTVFSKVTHSGNTGSSLSGGISFFANGHVVGPGIGVGSATYQAVIDQLAYSLPATVNPIISLNNLVINQQYQVQVWAAQDAQPQNATSYTSGANVASLTVDPEQYVIGTFTASAATETFTYTSTTTVDYKIVSAIALRTIPTPEPTGFMLACFGALGLFRVVRRRTVA